jgi:hypothetical protein
MASDYQPNYWATCVDAQHLGPAVRWVQRNADVLLDSHGIGGDRSRGESCGFASWSRRIGILVLRDPSTGPSDISVNLHDAFELPTVNSLR